MFYEAKSALYIVRVYVTEFTTANRSACTLISSLSRHCSRLHIINHNGSHHHPHFFAPLSISVSISVKKIVIPIGAATATRFRCMPLVQKA